VTSLASLPALFSFRHDEELARLRVSRVAVVIAVERLDDKAGLREEQLGLAPVEVVKGRRSADPMDRSVVAGLVVPDPLRHSIDVGAARRELADRASALRVNALPFVDDAAILADHDVRIRLEHVDRDPAAGREMLAHATPEVLVAQLPRELTSQLIAGALKTGRLTPESVLEVAPPAVLAEHL